MPSQRVTRTAHAAACALALATTTAAHAQQPPVLELYFGGVERLLDNEKDAGLARAWQLSGDRLSELPGELQAVTGDRIEGLDWALSLARRFRSSELHVSAAMDFDLMAPEVALTLWPTNEADARNGVTSLRSIASRMEGAPPVQDADLEGFWSMAAPNFPPILVGNANRSGGNALVVAVSDAALNAAANIERSAIFSGALNLRHLNINQDLIGDPMAASFMQHAGLFGPEAWHITWNVDRNRDKLEADVRVHDAQTLLARFGVTPDTTFDTDSLRTVPRDATYVAAAAYDFSAIPDVIRETIAVFGLDEDELENNEAARMAMGFITTLTDALGDDIIVYRSLTTGGGGILSTIVSVEVEDPQAVEIWLDRIAGLGSGAAAMALQGYVSVKKDLHDEDRTWSVRSNGLPLPLDITVALAADRLVVGVTSNTVRAAVEQLRAPNRSILERADFRQPMNPALRGDVALIGLEWRDMPWHAERSYGIAEIAGVAIANAVRPRFAGARDPGPVTPAYSDFIAGIDNAASWTYWDGQDVASYAESDGSFLVNLAVNAKEFVAGQALSLAPTMLGTSLPAFADARSNANEIMSVTQLRQIAVAAMAYAADHNDQMPPSFDALEQAGYVAELESPFGPTDDGGPDFAIASNADGLHEVQEPARTPFAIDRAMYLDSSQQSIAVAFYDGHVETLTRAEFERVLANDPAVGEQWGIR